MGVEHRTVNRENAAVDWENAAVDWENAAVDWENVAVVDYFAVVGTSVGGGEDVVGDDNCHIWVGKCYKNDD